MQNALQLILQDRYLNFKSQNQNLNSDRHLDLLKSLSSDSLLNHTKALIAEERKLTLLIIECFEEIDRRKLHHLRGYESLFEMCVKGFGYSESQAHRRISAMRVSQEMQETKQAIEEGKLTIATWSTSSIAAALSLCCVYDPNPLIDFCFPELILKAGLKC